MMPAASGHGALQLPTQMLTSPGDTLTDPPRNVPVIWVSLSPVALTHIINHCRCILFFQNYEKILLARSFGREQLCMDLTRQGKGWARCREGGTVFSTCRPGTEDMPRKTWQSEQRVRSAWLAARCVWGEDSLPPLSLPPPSPGWGRD